MNNGLEPPSDPPLTTWYRQNDLRSDFRSRLASQSTLPDNETKLEIDYLMRLQARSRQTSTFANDRSENDLESMATDNPPPLTRGNSVASTSSTISADMISVVDGGRVLESEDGILTVPARLQQDATLLCPFQILDCDKTFSDVVEFKVHVFSHFRGHPLPVVAPCFICERTFHRREEDDNALAWNNMLTHMANTHYRGDDEVCVLKADIAVMRHMWNNRIISDATFKRVQSEAPETRLPGASIERNGYWQPPEAPMAPAAPTPLSIRQHFGQSVGSQNQPYVVFASSRNERRQRNRTMMMAR